MDKKGAVLDIVIGKPKGAISREIGNDIVVQIDPKTKEIFAGEGARWKKMNL